eukprot:1645087-Amphidinium_carterae.1
MCRTGFVRGTVEACAYLHPSWKVVVTHHIDDARIVGPKEAVDQTVAHIKAYLLIKVSAPLLEHSSHNYLGRDWVRTCSGYLIVPARKHMEKVMDILGFT